MSWYPPPPPHYAQDYAGAGYPPPYGGNPAAPPPGGYAAPQQGGYPPYGGGHYAQPPPPPQAGYYGAPPPQPAYPQPQPMMMHHHQQQPRYPDYGPPAPAPAPVPVQHQYTPPPPVTAAPPPLKEGELRPPPDVAHDPNSFRRYFKQQLDHLTYNSKPVITSLTLFAHEHAIRMASVVAQCFDEHLRTCPPQYLLPAFYLLDSICKNIGAPYIALFSRFIERAFLSAYHAVDPVTRTKLEELLGTWKTGGNDGGELFREPDEPREGARVQRGIEAALFGARGRGDGLGGRATKDAEMYHAGVQQLPHTATTTERSGVLYDVRRLLTLRQENAPPAAGATGAADQINASQIVALKKLEHLILNTQLTTEQVTQIRNQLQALAPPPPPPSTGRGTSASPLPPPAAVVPSSTTTAMTLSPLVQQQQGSPPPPHSYAGQQHQHLSPPPPPGPPGPQQYYQQQQQQQQQQPRHFSPHPAAPTPPPPPPPPAPAPAAAAAAASPVVPAPASNPAPGVVNGIDLGLLSQLSASGALANLFGGSRTGSASSPALAHAHAHAKVEEQKPDVVVLVKAEEVGTTPTTTTATRREKVPLVERDEMATVWEQEAIRFGVTLNSGDLATPRPHALAVLYLQLLPLQCRQCGLRQPESRTGKRKMDEHLDWHFVHKRRMREAAGRASGRSWFTSEEDWYTSDATHHPLSAADQPSSALLSAGAAATAAASASQPGAGGTIDRAALQKLKVAVPAAGTPEAALGLGDKPCPICQDRFKSEWSDEEEEWVWWNAVVVDKVLYHATCHAEAALSRSNAVAASSASAAASRASLRTSRESTPNATAAGSKKRKADSVDPAAVANEVTQSTTATSSSPLKPKVEGEGTQGGTEEPDPKRVKAEPQEEEEQVNVVGTLDLAASEVGALEQPAAAADGETSREPTPPPPVFSTSSSLFLPE